MSPLSRFAALLALPLLVPSIAHSGGGAAAPAAACSVRGAGAGEEAQRLHASLRNVSCLAPGLSALEFSCSSGPGLHLDFHELLLEPGAQARLGAVRNAGSVYDPSCPSGYGGADIHALDVDPGILAATNGNFFMRSPRGPSGNPGFVSIGLVWSRPRRAAPGSASGAASGDGTNGVLAPLRSGGGNELFVLDASGGHKLRLAASRCGRRTCFAVRDGNGLSASRLQALSRPLPPEEFVRSLQEAFPDMTLAMQLNMDISGEAAYAACPDESSRDWRCLSAPRTVLCARADGTVSVLTSSPARVQELARALRPGGSCHAECGMLFNLDGGGSTQLAFRPAGTGPLEIHGHPTGTSQPGRCGEFRAVDHYLVWTASGPPAN